MDVYAAREEQALDVISRHTSCAPALGIILGSGQGGFSRRLTGAKFISYRNIPFFFQPLVPGHEGVFTTGSLGGRPVAVLEGRIHLCEGYFMREIVFPVRVLYRMGVRDLIICNAAGGLSERLAVGQVMMVAYHLNLMGSNPLIGQIHQGADSPFVSMSDTYDPGLRRLAREAGDELGDALAEGVLAAVPGPSYETPAESRMLRVLGADAVTMSSVPEVIMARFLGMRVLAFSLITNTHGSRDSTKHRDVMLVARRRTGFLMDLIARVALKINPNEGAPSVAGGGAEGTEA
jgi:purine-nucleoside phosphorylase